MVLNIMILTHQFALFLYNVGQCQYADVEQSKVEVYARFAQVKMNELKILRRGESELNPFKV